MRDQAVISRRALASAIPFAALAAAPAAALPALASADAELLDVGRRWEAAWDAFIAHDRTWNRSMSDEAAQAHDAVSEQLYSVEIKLFDTIMATPPRSLNGLALKAQAVARAHDVEDRGLETAEAALEGTWDIARHSALALAVDVLQLARSMA